MESNINETPENNFQSPNLSNSPEFGFTGKTLFFISETGKWSRYYSLFNIVLIGIIIAILLFSAMTIAYSQPNIGIFLAMILAVSCVLVLTGVLPMWFLMRSSKNIKEGLQSEFLPDLLKGLDDMSSFFKISSIIACVGLALLLIGFCLFLIFQGSILSIISNMKPIV